MKTNNPMATSRHSNANNRYTPPAPEFPDRRQRRQSGNQEKNQKGFEPSRKIAERGFQSGIKHKQKSCAGNGQGKNHDQDAQELAALCHGVRLQTIRDSIRGDRGGLISHCRSYRLRGANPPIPRPNPRDGSAGRGGRSRGRCPFRFCRCVGGLPACKVILQTEPPAGVIAVNRDELPSAVGTGPEIF